MFLLNLLLMYNRFQYLLSFTSIICLSACLLPKKKALPTNEKDIAVLLKTDIDFAAKMASVGIKTAYLEYIDSNGVMLKPNVLPMTGADAVDYIIAMKDEGYVMVWNPKSATVAASGELGFTYGTYELQPPQKDTVYYGTYVNIWKKQVDGNWKFVLHTENEGVEE
jgi:ketosteroid isomerase-like protein